MLLRVSCFRTAILLLSALPVAAGEPAGSVMLSPQIPASQPASHEMGAREASPLPSPRENEQLANGQAGALVDFTLDEPEPPRRAVLAFDEATFDLTVEGLYRNRYVRNRPAQPNQLGLRQTNKIQRFAETIGVSASGNLVNDRVLKFDFTGRFGLSQERYDESQPGRDIRNSPYGRALEYDARVTLFPAGKLTANLFASQSDDRVPRPFLPSLDRRRERFGAELLWNDAVLPMRLAFESSRDALTSPDPRLIDTQESDVQRLEYELTWHPSDRHELRLRYEYADQSERYSGLAQRFDTVRNYLTLNDTLRFGSEGQHSLDTIARFQDESGDLARDTYEFAPLLRLSHTPSLATTYRFQHYQDRFARQTVRIDRGDFGLTHEVKDWLNSAINLYLLKQDQQWAGDTREWGITGNFALRRANRWGDFSANLNYMHSESRLDPDRRIGYVIAEAVTFRDPLPVSLSQPDVITGTILVTNPERTLLLRQGIDYLVIRAGRNTLLTRVRTGRIRDNQTVFISYQYDVTPRLEVGRDRVDFRVQQAFKSGWTPYYATSYQAESLQQQRLAPLTARDINRHRLGLRYQHARWSAGAEFEYNDDSIDPYQAGHFNADWSALQNARHTLDFRAGCSYFDFRGIDRLLARTTTVLDAGTFYRYAINQNADMNASAVFRYEDDSLFGVTRGIDLTAGVQWQIALFTASVDLEYDYLRLPGSRDESFSVWFRLRREFPLIGLPRSAR